MSILTNKNISKCFQPSSQANSFDQTNSEIRNNYTKRPSVSWDETVMRQTEQSTTSQGLDQKSKSKSDLSNKFKKQTEGDLKRVRPLPPKNKHLTLEKIPEKCQFDSVVSVSSSSSRGYQTTRRGCDRSLCIPVTIVLPYFRCMQSGLSKATIKIFFQIFII